MTMSGPVATRRTARPLLFLIAVSIALPVFVTSPPTAVAADESLAGLFAAQQALTALALRIEPAVVNVRRFSRDDAWWAEARTGRTKAGAGWRVVPDTDLLYPSHRPVGGGSGFLIGADGHLLTLHQVVVDPTTKREAEIVDVEVGSAHYQARVVALEPTIDLAILKIEPADLLPFLALGNSGVLEPGQFTFAFGNPDGPEKTLVPGVVVQPPNRDCYQEELSATYVQISMQVPAGALGGPVVNLAGEVIAISTRRGDAGAITAPTAAPGSGFALPINLATAIYESLLARASRESPWLGISVLLLSDEARRKAGVPAPAGILIDNVYAPSPAAELGLQIGDVLTKMQGEDVRTVYDFQRLLYAAGVGAEVSLGLLRDGEPRAVTARVASRPQPATTR